MKKYLRSLISSVFVFTVGIFPVITPVSVHASSYTNKTATEYVTLGTYYISKENVKAMAKVMRTTTGPIANIIAGLLGFTSPYMSVAMLAASLSSNAQARTEVLYAADHNMRVKVVIKDQKVHTSYSAVVEFTAVK